MALATEDTFVASCCTDNVFRVTWRPMGVFDPAEVRTWSVVGTKRRDRPFDAAGICRADVSTLCFEPVQDVAREDAPKDNTQAVVVQHGNVRCVRRPSLGSCSKTANALQWEFRPECATVDGRWTPFHQDLHYRQEDDSGSCGFGSGLVHRFVRHEEDCFYGLGETSGCLNKRGRRIRMRPTDCMGYDAETTDPLYKHLPFLIVYRPECSTYYGIFYDTTHECLFDLGCEMNNYYGTFATFATRSTSLDYYLIVGPTLSDVVTTFSCCVVGCVPLQPAWTFGYLGSAMGYTDDPRGAAALGDFLGKCTHHAVACTGFHLSSGYSMADNGLRYVFEWHPSRYADPKALSCAFHNAGVRLIANIKPAMLTSHPRFQEAIDAGHFISDASGVDSCRPELTLFWGGDGAHLNFLDEATRRFWKRRVTDALLDNGIDATWNDNNEYTEVSGTCRCALGTGTARSSNETVAARGVRCVQTLLMTGSSYEAQLERQSTPFVLSRSGMYGSHRLASTWTGDNYTSWKTLEFNLPMGLGLAISGWSNVGHDIGGFSGPVPSPELMFRWLQQGVLHPRCTIHSWKLGHPENSCWMYEAEDAYYTAVLSALTRLRFQIIPWLVEVNRLAATRGVPMMAPPLFYHPFLAAYRNQHRFYYLGPNVLVVPPLVEGVDEWEVADFPPGEWWSLDGKEHFECVQPSPRKVAAPRRPDVGGSGMQLLPPVYVLAGTVLPMVTPADVPFSGAPREADAPIGVILGIVGNDFRRLDLHCYPSRRCDAAAPSLLESPTLPTCCVTSLRHALPPSGKNAKKAVIEVTTHGADTDHCLSGKK